MRTFINEILASFQRSIEALGGQWEPAIADDPASEKELSQIEAALGRPIPTNVRQFASTVSRRIFFGWTLPDGFALPDSLTEISSGGIDFDISKLPEHESGRASWQRECFPNAEDSYDVVWHGKIGFHHVPNGDYLAIDSEGRVIYLSHDDGEGHGYVMASSFADLIDRWLPLGCPGPEDWQWLPFVTDSLSGVLPEGDVARLWLSVIHSRT